MKVVARGPDSRVVRQVVCRGCGATVEYVPNDVRELYRGKDISGCGEGRDGFSCPSCGKDIVTRSW